MFVSCSTVKYQNYIVLIFFIYLLHSKHLFKKKIEKIKGKVRVGLKLSWTKKKYIYIYIYIRGRERESSLALKSNQKLIEKKFWERENGDFFVFK